MNWKKQLMYVRGLLILEMRKEVVSLKRCHELTQAISHIKDCVIEEYENDNYKRIN